MTSTTEKKSRVRVCIIESVGSKMKMRDNTGNQIYFNAVEKHGQTVYIIKAITPGLVIPDRDRKPHRSRTFTQLAQAERWLERMGYHGY